MDFGDLVLVIGDLHVPQRASGFPDCFKELLSTDKIKTVLCTGNSGSAAALEDLRQLGQEFHCVRGEADDRQCVGELPDSVVVEIGQFRVGMLSGYQCVPWGDENALGTWARKLDVDILITGHTHECKVWPGPGSKTMPDGASSVGGTLFLNPGSATGASNQFSHELVQGVLDRTRRHGGEAVMRRFSGVGSSSSNGVTPSFMLLAVQGNKICVYIYKEVDGDTSVDQWEHSKA